MKGLCSYCSRYFFCSKRPKQNEEDVILCSSFTQNNDNEENIWEQRRYEIAKDVAAGQVLYNVLTLRMTVLLILPSKSQIN